MTAEPRLTDLGEQMDAIRDEALKRLRLVEGRPDFHRKGGVYETFSTDQLVERVESSADFYEDGLGGPLGRWATTA